MYTRRESSPEIAIPSLGEEQVSTPKYIPQLSRRELLASSVLLPSAARSSESGGDVRLENEHFALAIDSSSGALSSFVVKRNRSELVQENRLRANFRLCVPLPDYLCNYIDGETQKAAVVEKSGDTIHALFRDLTSSKGTLPIELSYWIQLDHDCVRFRSSIKNKGEYPISEFWFPRIGGWTAFGSRNARLATPEYGRCRHELLPFRQFPGSTGLGAEGSEFSRDYPGMTMPWWSLYDNESDTGLYLGYHDPVFRFSSWHAYLMPEVSGAPGDNWLTPEQAAGETVGMVFSHVRYPFVRPGETFDAGEFVIRVHKGDWHAGATFYREWFLRNFPFDNSKSWLRKQRTWFSCILYQPEDRIVADYKTYDKWCRDAEGYGIRCHELIGWDKGGLERDYPEYIPEKKLGGREGYRALLRSIRSRGSRCLTFVNYNILDSSSELYKKKLHRFRQQDNFGITPNRMNWGESTLLARKGLSVRRHVLSSLAPGMQRLLEGYFLELVRDGADGFQIDKTVASRGLDFNPLNTRRPDEALQQGLVDAIAATYEKCRRVNPEFRLASEHNQDRLVPYVDVAYRACSGYDISPLRFVFPEWTSAQHITSSQDFRGVNGAVLTGAVICVEPRMYSGSLADPIYRKLAEYIREVERLRGELAGIIFLGRYLDDQGAAITDETRTGQDRALYYAVHAHPTDGRRALVVANDAGSPRKYSWKFDPRSVNNVTLYAPFAPARVVARGETLEIPAVGLHILVASPA